MEKTGHLDELRKRFDIPQFIINLLNISGYNNRVAFSNFSEEDVDALENFARDILPNIIDMNDENDRNKYYGFFGSNYKKIVIPCGYRKTLIGLKEHLPIISSNETSNDSMNTDGNKNKRKCEDSKGKKKMACEVSNINFDLNEERMKLNKTLKNYIVSLKKKNELKVDEEIDFNVRITMSSTSASSAVSAFDDLLTKSHLKSDDKMNFEAVERIIDERVQKYLSQYVPGSEGTVAFLKVISLVLESFLQKDMDIKMRIEKLWFAVFFLRIWRHWLQKNKFTLKSHFISSNAYTCIELNAHALILLALRSFYFKEKLFLPWMMSSQPCEKTFRALRSMSSTFSTVVNFSMLDILHRIYKLQALNDIMCELKEDIKFPRELKKEKSRNDITLISESRLSYKEIEKIIQESKEEALKFCSNLGICIESSLWENIGVSARKDKQEDHRIPVLSDSDECDFEEIRANSEVNLESNIEIDAEDENVMKLHANTDELELPDFSEKCQNSQAESLPKHLVRIHRKDKEILVKKSTLCWFSEDKSSKRLSSDRLQRVRGPYLEKFEKFKKAKIDSSLCNLARSEEIGERNSLVFQGSTVIPRIELSVEKYYAVAYSDCWYIGRIMEMKEKGCVIKFLKRELDLFKWPTKDDVQNVTPEFIFDGPVLLKGSHPFQIVTPNPIEI